MTKIFCYGITQRGTIVLNVLTNVEKPTYYQINSIVKTFKLIELLVSKREFDLAEINRLLQFTKTTTHRILLTLKSLGYVEQSKETLRYRASMRFFELGWKMMQNINLIEIAHPFMVELSQVTGETVNLGVLEGLEIICVDKAENKHHVLRQDQPTGSRSKAYCTAFGKAALAFLPREKVERFFSADPIVPSTAKSLKTLKEIQKNLQKVRELGYSVDDEEFADGIRCVGAPIFDHNGEVVAGLSVAGPSLRIKKTDVQYLAKLVMETTATISKKLGAGQGPLNPILRKEEMQDGHRHS